MSKGPRVALVWHGDREARNDPKLEEHRLGTTARGLRKVGLAPEAAVYNDDFADEVLDQLLGADAALVWVNPIEQGRNRSKLDAVLQQAADLGVFVSAHPRTIQKMGTKQVLYDTREMPWGSDVEVYRTAAEFRTLFPGRMQSSGPRVLKQHRGHSGYGIWKVSRGVHTGTVRVRHAQRGSVEKEMPMAAFLAQCDEYFEGEGRIIDQAYRERLAEGMVRCYLVDDRVAGFGHQEINALYPVPEGGKPQDAPQPGPRLYYPPTLSEFQDLKAILEDNWISLLLRTVGMTRQELPVLWDADFFFGPQPGSYVLCEINVSSVYPYPDDAIGPLALALKARLGR